MFGWGRATCPIDAETKKWIDERWRWLTAEFGRDRPANSPNILPTSEFFPDPYDRSNAAVEALLNRTCGYMNVARELIELSFYSNARQPYLVNEDGHAIGHSAGTYQKGHSKFIIRIERSQFDAPITLVGTVAHELAHVRLLGEQRLARDAFDNELLTDLTVVFHGMGIFPANCPRHWRSSVSVWPDTDVPKPHYMTTPMYGYALALRARTRKESPDSWKQHLKPGVRAEFKHSLKYLSSVNS